VTRTGWRDIAAHSVTLWIAFILVHLTLGLINLKGPGYPLGDVDYVYRFWTDQAVIQHFQVGIDASWVYPILAIVPMFIARAFGVAHYSATWLALIMLLDAIAFAALVGWGRRRQNTAIAWWWLGFLLLLGPIALGRIDSVSVAVAIVGVLLLATRPQAAALLLTIATWIKVWPAAIIAAVLIASRDRVRVAITAALTSIAIIAVVVLVSVSHGSGIYVFSFITEQTGRGLQVEAPVSTIWLWGKLLGIGHTIVYYDTTILTYQVRGAGVDAVSAVMTPVLVIALLAIVVVGILAARNRAPVAEVLPSLSLAFVTAFIAFNKVGSPQYVTWLAVPVILGLATRAVGHGKPFRTPAVIVLVIAALTQVIYPYWYSLLLSADPFMLVVITTKDVLLFVLLGWAVASLVRSAWAVTPQPVEESEWLPAVWPFGRS
jgi:hypothetical protein